MLSIVLILAAISTSCHASGAQVWGIDRDELTGLLARSEYEPLRHVSFARHRLDEIEALGDDAPFALGVVYGELGIDDVSESLLRLAYDESPEPWRGAARDRLVDMLSAADRDAEIEPLVRDDARAAAAGDADGLPALLAHLASLYSTESYQALLDELDDAGTLLQALPSSDARAGEIALWRAVTLIELGRDGWEGAVRTLYRDYAAARVHSRVWIYLATREELLSHFESSELDFFRAKALLADGTPVDAADVLLRLANGDSPGAAMLRTRVGIVDLYRAGSRAGRMTATATGLAAAANRDASLAPLAYELAGRLSRSAGRNADAIAWFDRALGLRLDADSQERVRWYRFSSEIRLDPVAASAHLISLVPTFDDPAYYADVLDELAGLLTEHQAWDAILQAYQAIADFATPGTLARYEIVLARAIETGRLYAAPARAEELRQRYLERAYAQREDRFSALLAATLLGRDGVEVLDIADAPSTDDGVPPPLAATYLRYGLLDDLSNVLGSATAPASFLVTASHRLADAGRIRESILAVGAYESRVGASPERVLELRYPLAYAALMDGRVAAEGVDRPVFYALIREESLFDPEIASVAGAVGLSQLMPATAEDIARRMKLDVPTLTDPAQNIAIGARYLSMLNDQFGTTSRALAAYNAGQGNVRQWERRWAGLDEVLFHQAMPFPETFNHVRKIVVSAAYYGYLYEQRDPDETVRLIFNLK